MWNKKHHIAVYIRQGLENIFPLFLEDRKTISIIKIN